MKWEFLINPNSYESESSSHAMPKRKLKRKPTKEQLRNLAKGRAIRKRNLLKEKRKTRRPKRKRKRKPTKEQLRNLAKGRAIRKSNMTKRRRTNGSLTGGTGDVNPQILTMSWDHEAGATLKDLQFHSPVAKGLFAKANHATVMEVLKVWFHLPLYKIVTVAATIDFRRCCVATQDMSGVIADGRLASVYAMAEQYNEHAFTAAGSFSTFIDNIYVYDLTDGTGHGILVAGDYIYMQSRIYPADTALTNWVVKMLYRFKNVSLTEYIGIVQSQQ